jgi:hypothetical protein
LDPVVAGAPESTVPTGAPLPDNGEPPVGVWSLEQPAATEARRNVSERTTECIGFLPARDCPIRKQGSNLPFSTTSGADENEQIARERMTR